MLQSLHVKNLALLEEAEVEFGKGLNILTGETGAGKSLLLGSVNLALGAKFEKDMLRKGAESALVELVFVSTDEKVLEKLAAMEVTAEEDGTIIISRKLQLTKSVYRINGETVTARQVKELAEYLLDIHGQHEHQSLLNKKKHMQILDSFCGSDYAAVAEELAGCYRKCRELRQELEQETLDETSRAREQSLAEFEWQEIEAAKLIPGEDEALEQQYRRMTNSQKIVRNLAESYQYSGSEDAAGAGNAISRALRALRSITGYDERLEQLEEQLSEVENLLSDYNRDVAEYISDCEFDEEDFRRTEDRLNTINHLKGKYGRTIEDILQYAEEKQAYLDKLSDYDAYIQKLQEALELQETVLRQLCERLSELRSRNAVVLAERLKEALLHLNFNQVQFEIAVRPQQQITANGYDDVEFMISTNPGEGLKSLSQVASGGELSRVMLAIKTVLAGRDEIDTLIFDEIDAGISGKTAWRVSEQLHQVACAHQVICITHLPQIAAMADTHFVIEKSSDSERTVTEIKALDRENSLSELARLLGSDALTEAALSNAREMKEQALAYKQGVQGV